VGEDRTGEAGATNQRVTVPEAAELLGITAEAVRMRIKRATLRSERQGGRVFVLLGPERPTEQTTERTGPTEDRTAELIDTLREQLQAERQAHAEARRIIAGLVERIPPAMEAPAEAREAPETAAEESERAEHYSAARGTQEATRRPWWRRWLRPGQ
jgi:flagellar biosynthesis GTPase FlhF